MQFASYARRFRIKRVSGQNVIEKWGFDERDAGQEVFQIQSVQLACSALSGVSGSNCAPL